MNIPKINFNLPKKNSVLIFDHLNAKYLEDMIKPNKTFIINIRNSVNLFAGLYALFFFYRSSFKIEYINFFLKKSKTKLLVSFGFKRIILYNLKKYNPDVKFIVIQSGSYDREFLSLLKKNNHQKLFCDYFFCYSNLHKKTLSKFINANYITAGSIYNNHYKINNRNKKKEAIFISQYRKNILDVENKHHFPLEYIRKGERFILPILYKFCLKNNLKLSILPGEPNIQEQQKHYSKILNNKNFYIYKRDITKSYNIIDKVTFSVSISSTLGYEAIARGIKTCIVTCNNFIGPKFKNQIQVGNTFLDKQSEFYVSHCDGRKLNKTFLNLLKLSNSKYKEINNSKEFMEYDANNSKLGLTIKNILNN